MITLFFKISMFISSYSPLYLFILILNWSQVSKNPLLQKYVLAGIIILLTWSMLTVLVVLSNKGNENIDLEGASLKSDEIISYIVTYVVPLITIDINDFRIVLVNILLFIVIGVGYIHQNLIYLNPSMLIFKYRIYEKGSWIALSNMSLDEMKNNKYKLLSKELIPNVYIVRKKDN
ncbi:hypothetical protein [Listeria aquatica]|uniref:hypothetical protein n=1 Tax=Listeria aquatica TaxID=1494960 RepID=UPI0031F57499